MNLRPITQKPKNNKGIALIIIILIIVGFIVSVYLFGQGAIKEIIHP